MAKAGDVPQVTPQPSVPQLPNYTGAADSAYGILSQMPGNNIPGQIMPQYQQLVSQLTSNPNVNTASQMGMDQAQKSMGMGNNLATAGMSMVPFANQMMQTGFDPQGALYNRTQQTVQDQTRAATNARGLGMTPYGAGVENKAMSDFNIDWQDRALGRMGAAAGGANTLFNTAGNATNTGLSFANQAPGMFSQFGTLPQNTGLGALDTLGRAGMNANVIPAQAATGWMNYLGAGNQNLGQQLQAWQALNQLQMQQQQAAAQQEQGMWGGIGQLAGTGLQAAMFMSDVRMKTDVKRVGTRADGYGLYRYRYLGDDVARVGVLAQEVLEVEPDAVARDEDGILYVNYGMIGGRPTLWRDWVRAQ